MTWNLPDADPLVDIKSMMDEIHASDFHPNKILVAPSTFVLLVAIQVFPGRGPINWIKRRIFRWSFTAYLRMRGEM